jgi:hypothetical protein
MTVSPEPLTGELSDPAEIVPGLATVAPSTYTVNWLAAMLDPELAVHVPTMWCQLLSFNAVVPSTPINIEFESSPNITFPAGFANPEIEPQLLPPQAPAPSSPRVRECPLPAPRSCTITDTLLELVLTHASIEYAVVAFCA